MNGVEKMNLTDYIKMWDDYFLESIKRKSYIPNNVVLKQYFESYKSLDSDTKKLVDYMPEPFLGNPQNAHVAIVNKNPGGVAPWQHWGNGMEAVKIKENVLEKNLKMPYSKWANDFIYLKKKDIGSDFWINRIKYVNSVLDKKCGSDGDGLLGIELYPWHSGKFQNEKYENCELNFKEFVLQPLMDTDVKFVFLLRKYVIDVAENCGIEFETINHDWEASTLIVKIAKYKGKIFIGTDNNVPGYPGSDNDRRYLRGVIKQIMDK